MEKAIPLPPENHVTGLLNHNSLSQSSRATLDLAWRNLGIDELSTVGPELSSDKHTYLDFWENGAVAPLPHFSEIVEEATRHPELYTRQMIADVSAFAAPINGDFNHCLTTDYALTEAKAIIQLDEYLDTVVEESSSDDNEIYNKAVGLKEQLGYLDESRFEEGIEVLVKMWSEYLKENQNAYINVVKRQGIRHPKSFEYVLERLKSRIAEIDLSAALRVVDFPEGWKDTEGSKLVVLDDWVISGQTAGKMVTEALQQTEKRRLTGLDQNIEVHSIAREASAQTIPGVTYRTVYLHDSGTDYTQVSMTGSHSSVNYGFEHPLRDMQKYLQKKGVFIPAPLLMATEPTTYRDLHIANAIKQDKDGKTLKTVQEQNQTVLLALTEIFRLEKSVYDFEKDKSQSITSSEERRQNLDRIVSIRVGLKKLSEERAALRQIFGLKKDKV